MINGISYQHVLSYNPLFRTQSSTIVDCSLSIIQNVFEE